MQRFLSVNAAALRDLATVLRVNPPPMIVTCARGFSDHAATYGKHLFETPIGVLVWSNAMSVASVYRAATAKSLPYQFAEPPRRPSNFCWCLSVGTPSGVRRTDAQDTLPYKV